MRWTLLGRRVKLTCRSSGDQTPPFCQNTRRSTFRRLCYCAKFSNKREAREVPVGTSNSGWYCHAQEPKHWEKNRCNKFPAILNIKGVSRRFGGPRKVRSSFSEVGGILGIILWKYFLPISETLETIEKIVLWTGEHYFRAQKQGVSNQIPKN